MNIYSTFSDKMYSTYLKRRYGINSCCNTTSSLQELSNDLSIADYIRTKVACKKKVYYTVNTTDKVQEGLYIAVEIGTPQAAEWGLQAGDSTFIHPLLKDRNIQLFRNNVVVTPFDRGPGSVYFIKSKSSDTIDFRTPLEEGEIIQLNTI